MSAPALTDANVVGALIARSRKAKGVFQSELAQVLSVQQTWISRMERGLVEPTPTQLLAICDRLEIDPETFAGLPLLTRSDDERLILAAYRRIRTESAREDAIRIINSIGALQENASC
ncbi:transcriptional regulator, XRE family [Methylorubrum populi BJ001]|jgi:transcriptional regulator with XRE-family HTH domain|uniref:Transcriptional regulator, XRE family n=1 Tax=Methylorubrum populi (strain ATCC BAA-705 / NCIMB 13946 / BJ001) TaxID=441620 RepID=B1ZD15_METPB|nr:helix-turn-helix transcriptional regulator [Methylorubrum populi]ACB80884.1 transcriptional regulator, XRE family [Methylorubrum populi BJ001]